jgi:hypothetical protein
VAIDLRYHRAADHLALHHGAYLMNVKLVRRGITRTIWLVGRWAIKVPSLRRYDNGLAGIMWSFSRGVQANLSEAGWHDLADEKSQICPVLWSLGGLINVYPRCRWVDDIDAELLDAGLVYPGKIPGYIANQRMDAKPDNVGWLRDGDDERLVWLDYDLSYNGCPHNMPGISEVT